MIELDPVKYSHHYINPAAPKAVVPETYYKDEQDAYVSKVIRRSKEIRRYFENNIAQNATQKSFAIDDKEADALDLFQAGENENFKTYNNKDGVTIIEYDTKKQGFKKVTVINVFENGVLKRRIEITPNKSVSVKEFIDNINHYDYYEANLISGKRVFKENVREKNDGFSTKTFIDKIYTYQGSFLKKYEEGFNSEKVGSYPKTTIRKRFCPNYITFTVDYSENITKDSPFKREKTEFQAEAPFKRFKQD